MSYETEVQVVLQSAPSPFGAAFATLGGTDGAASFQAFRQAISSLRATHPSWAGTASACCAWLLMRNKQYEPALALADQGREIGLTLPGWYYYYDAVVDSLNMLDRLPKAADAAREAIAFYRPRDAAVQEAEFSLRLANILKQLAFHASQSPASHEEARAFVLEALGAIDRCLQVEGDPDANVREELDGLSRIAARCALPLAAVEALSAHRAIVARFGRGHQEGVRVMDLFNLGQSAVENGDRHTAHGFYSRALEQSPEDTAVQRAFKILLAYQLGLNLWKLHEMQRPAISLNPHDWPPEAEQVRDAWRTCLRLYETLTLDEVKAFIMADVRDIVWSIKQDPIIRE
jgi:tetratricopeptide (TPR) repeat protein